MRVATSLTSMLAALCLAALATSAPSVVLAQSNGNATEATPTPSQDLVFDPAAVVQEIIMGDQPNAGGPAMLVVDGNTAGRGPALTPEVRNPFLETIAVHRPFDDMIVKTPNVGPIVVVKVKNGKKSKSKRKPLRPPQNEYIYGEYMILRLRSITNELVTSIRAAPDQPTEQGLVLTHTVSNTKVSSQSTTTGWEAEATVTARAEASGDLFGFGVSASTEFSTTVRRSVSTTFESSKATTVEVSKEASFTLQAPAGKEAALWVSKTQLDVFVCKSRTKKVRTNPINSQCVFSHSVVEEGKKYEVTLTSFDK